MENKLRNRPIWFLGKGRPINQDFKQKDKLDVRPAARPFVCNFLARKPEKVLKITLNVQIKNLIAVQQNKNLLRKFAQKR